MLRVVFDGALDPWDIPMFRAAMIEKVGREHLSFHNHLNNEEYLQGYPVIQYKSVNGKPSLVALDHGVDEAQHFFTKKDWSVRVGERVIDLKVDRVDLREVRLQVWDKLFTYRIHNWIALNQANYQEYLKLKNQLEKIMKLESVMKGNILSFAKGMKWRISREIILRINELSEPKVVPYKDQKLTAFDATITTNVYLPDHIGLGKGVSRGYGNIRSVKKKSEAAQP